MHSWQTPRIPVLPGTAPIPQLFDDSSGELRPAGRHGDRATLYVCGITPYDATHLGHASTYLAFDTLNRLWRDAGLEVRYAQNVTDVDDPLLERATATGVDWRDLAVEQTNLFRSDMATLAVMPPDDYVAVTDVVDAIADAVAVLRERGFAYAVDTPEASDPSAADLYFDSTAAAKATDWFLGAESRLDTATMATFFAQRGGDPDREGKRNPLDPLLWRVARDGEPSWPSPVGRGRPGWHIECSVIAIDSLGEHITVQGGGSDLVFPHHEFSAAHATALTGKRFAEIQAHAGMVAYQGEKMSKSLGNLVLVSKLTAAGVDPRAIRLAILSHHYRSDWEWTDADLTRAIATVQNWAAVFSTVTSETSYRAATFNGAPQNAVPGSAVPHGAVPHSAVPHSAVPHAAEAPAGGLTGDAGVGEETPGRISPEASGSLVALADSTEPPTAHIGGPSVNCHDIASSTAELELLTEIREALANDLDTPAAIARITEWLQSNKPSSAIIPDAIDALLGIRL